MSDPRCPSFVLLAAALGLSVLLAGPALHAAEPTPAHGKAAHKTAATPEPTADTPAAEATPAVPGATPLTAAQMGEAVTLDSFTIPTPGELFAALNKQCKPNWTAQARGPINTNYSDRVQDALNLGGLIADGYIAVEAQDGQQVKNIGRDILALANTLGIKKEILARGNSIQQFADDNDWSSLQEELESTQNEAKQAMDMLHDEELVTLLSVGAWIRGTQVVSNVVLNNFSQNTSCILRQPALVDFLRAKLEKLPPKTRDSALVKAVDEGLGEMAQTVSFPLGATAPKEDIEKLHEESSKLVTLIATKKEG